MQADNQLKYLGFWIAQKRAGMSQVELARKAGISQQQLSKIEAGENCTIKTLMKILAALGEKVELPEIFIEGTEENTTGTPGPFNYF